jgi:hypothetical protein
MSRYRSAAEELERLTSVGKVPVKPVASIVSFDERATLNEKTGLPTAVGRLYVVSNPAWPGIVKIGSSGDLSKRLSDYQTGSPYRDYRMVAFSAVFQDVKRAEFDLHDNLVACKVDGSREWFKLTEAQAVAAIGGTVCVDPFLGTGTDIDDDWT